MQYDSAHIAYLSDENGIVNRYLANLDSALAYVDTTEHYRMISWRIFHSRIIPEMS